MSIHPRIFLGYLQNKEIKMYLSQNTSWQKDKTLNETNLMETHWQNKEYIGLFIPSLLIYPQIKEKLQVINTQLQFYCPKLNLDKHSPYLLSQLFID